LLSLACPPYICDLFYLLVVAKFVSCSSYINIQENQMEKVGRNDPCPCGSGKKYKKCHGMEKVSKPKEKEEMTLLPGVYQIVVRKYFSQTKLNIDAELLNLKKVVFEATNKNFGGAIDGIGFFKEYLLQTEKLIQKIANKNTLYELLYWSRRLAPTNLFRTSNLSVMIYREIQMLSIYKYGKTKGNLGFDQHGSIHPEYIIPFCKMEYIEMINFLKDNDLKEEITNVIDDVIRIEILSYIYLRATQDYRILNKGGTFRIVADGYFVDTTKETDYLIKLYDDRLKNTNLFSRTGTYVEHNRPSTLDNIAFCPYFALNVDHKERSLLYNAKTESYKEIFKNGDEKIEVLSNYTFGYFDVKSIYEFLVLFEKEFEDYYDFTVKDFALFLSYLGFKIFHSFLDHYQAQFNILNRAYTIGKYNLEEFTEDFHSKSEELSKIVFNETLKNKVKLEKILSKFLLTDLTQNDIDLWTRGPKRFMYQLSSEYVVIDYYCLTDILSFIVKDITAKDGDVGNRRAISFEEAIETELKRILPPDKIWKCAEVIYAGQESREIDASFVKEDVLVILEAKAVNVSFGFDKGDKTAVEYRINKMKSAIAEVDDKVLFIKNNYELLKGKLPVGIKYVCSLVVSSYPEFIWEKTENLFLSEKMSLPRIVNVADMELISGLKTTNFIERSFCVELNHQVKQP
jgi:hypothetical protein